MNAHSLNFRELVVSYVDEGHTQADAARHFKLHPITVSRWIKLKNTTGSLRAIPVLRSPHKLPLGPLKSYVEAHPDAFLVDYTSDTDEFLILMASVHFDGRSVPLFFSIRNYPKRKNQFDQKKMKASFIKALRHILSKKYTYTIVADRGFGNSRFAQLCDENGFDFVLRINENLKIEMNGHLENLRQYDGKNTNFDARIVSSSKDYRIEIQTKMDQHGFW